MESRAYVALLMFVPLSLALTAATPKRHASSAAITIYLVGLMFLPELAAIDFPMVPPMDKNGFAAVMALIAMYMLDPKAVRAAKPGRGIDVMFFVLILGGLGTILQNPEPLVYGVDIYDHEGELWRKQRVLSGLKPYDLVAAVANDLVRLYLPFLVGRAAVRSSEDAETLFKTFVTIGMVYALPCLYEARMFPQFHKWIYGYPPTGLAGIVRGEGFKPVMFQNSGLSVAMFLVVCLQSCAVLMKRKKTVQGLPAFLPLGLLWVTLGLSHNAGATIYSLIVVPIILLSPGKLAMTTARVLLVATLLYPVVRSMGLINTEAIIEWIAERSPERAQSLQVRFVNEDMLMDRAKEQLWFGWGGFGRNRVIDEWGRDVSITDGEWVITIGTRGVIGFICVFSFLLYPISMANRAMKSIRDIDDRKLLEALALIAAINAVDLLPNALFTRMPFFVAGACAGLAQGLAIKNGAKPPL